MRALWILLASLSLLVPGAARADAPASGSTLRWNDDWPRFRPWEYVTTGILGPAAMAMYVWLPDQRVPHWVGGILFDDTVRNALRVHSPAAQRAIWTASDTVGVSVVVLAVGVDSLAVPIFRGSPGVSLQLGLMDAESFSMSSVIAFALYDSVGRARPGYVECQAGSASGQECEGTNTASFPSGHTAEVFTAAGVSCANHTRVPIYGSPFLDGLACGRDLFLATADGALRIMGDRHYATDMLAGAAIGFSFGYGLPTLLHYAYPVESRSSWTFSPLPGRRPGLALSGSF